MIKINVNNGRSIEISKSAEGVNVDILSKNKEVDYYYTITEAELVTMLNRFEHENNIS